MRAAILKVWLCPRSPTPAEFRSKLLWRTSLISILRNHCFWLEGEERGISSNKEFSSTSTCYWWLASFVSFFLCSCWAWIFWVIAYPFPPKNAIVFHKVKGVGSYPMHVQVNFNSVMTFWTRQGKIVQIIKKVVEFQQLWHRKRHKLTWQRKLSFSCFANGVRQTRRRGAIPISFSP